MPLFDHFDLLAPFYDRLINYHSRETLLTLAKLPVNGIILDAGGGTGRAAHALRDQVSHAIVADISYPMLQQAAVKAGLKPVQASAEEMPFKDGAFDRIIMVDAFHHLLNQSSAAKELWRTIKPGGIIVIEEPDIQKFPVKLVAIAEKVMMMRSHFLSSTQIEKLFSFSNTRIRVIHEGINTWIVVEKLT